MPVCNVISRPRIFLLATLLSGALAGCSKQDTGEVTEADAGAVKPAAFAAVDTARIKDSGSGAEWLSYGGNYDEQRHSSLDSVNTETVSDLGVTWTFDLKTNRGVESTPVVVDGVMFATSAWSVVYALDAKTGEELWTYNPQVDKRVGVKACCDVVNRGVAVYGGQVFVGIIDGRLEALDAKTGERNWSVVTVDQSKPYTITGAPRVVDGKVLIGNGGAELGVRGYLSAYDVTSGDLVWRFYTVPNPNKAPDNAASDSVFADLANDSWGEDGEWVTDGGGGTVWDSIVYDAVNDTVVFGVGNGSPWNRNFRDPSGGDNLFLSSIVAVDAKTGAYRWHYQTTPGDNWDYTATQSIILASLPIGPDGEAVGCRVAANPRPPHPGQISEPVTQHPVHPRLDLLDDEVHARQEVGGGGVGIGHSLSLGLPSPRLPDLGRGEAVVVGGVAADHEDPAVAKHRGRMSAATLLERGSWGERLGGRIPDLYEVKARHRLALRCPADDQDAPVGQEAGGIPETHLGERACRAERQRVRIPDLGRGEFRSSSVLTATNDQDAAVG